MPQHLTDPPDQLGQSSHEQEPHGGNNLTDQAGHALIAMLKQAANLSNGARDRGMTLADKLAVQLRAVEDRVKELEGEVEDCRDRAVRAEKWLQRIQREVQERFLAPSRAPGDNSGTIADRLRAFDLGTGYRVDRNLRRSPSRTKQVSRPVTNAPVSILMRVGAPGA